MPMLIAELQAARRRWWLFLLLGIGLVVLGLFALSAMTVVSLLSVIYFGCLLLIDGVAHVISAFSSRIGGGLFLGLLCGVLDIIIGLVLIARPAASAEALTAVLALFLLGGGLFRAIAAASLQYPGWVLSVLSGIIGVVLGTVILFQWAQGDVLYIIGLFVGIELIARGASWVVTSLALRRLPEVFPEQT
jgi:uncharacterized membrane protein HdeD (DUF308 family)